MRNQNGQISIFKTTQTSKYPSVLLVFFAGMYLMLTRLGERREFMSLTLKAGKAEGVIGAVFMKSRQYPAGFLFFPVFHEPCEKSGIGAAFLFFASGQST